MPSPPTTASGLSSVEPPDCSVPSHSRRFRVRLYECDGYGHLNNANFLRYMQETAFDASAAAGYDMAAYERLGRQFLIRQSEIEYLRPVRYGDNVRVVTWVVDFRRVRSRRAYAFFDEASGEPVARALTDWVFLDASSGKPATIPDELARAFLPNGSLPGVPPRTPFPVAPPAPEGVFCMRRQVAWNEIDPAEHVNNAVYLAYAEDAGTRVAAAYGWPMTRIKREGFAIIAREHRIEYLLPASFDDELEVCTWVSAVRRSTATRHFVISRVADGKLLARVGTLFVWVDVSTGRVIRIPPHFIADFAPNIVPVATHESLAAVQTRGA